MNFLNGKLRLVIPQELDDWEQYSHRFRCYLCGHKFELGDVYRWIYDNDQEGAGNFITCLDCDGNDVIKRWRDHAKDAETKFWWMKNE